MVLHTLGKKAPSTKESLVNPAGVFLCTFNLGKDRGLVFHYDTESHTHTQPSSVLFFQTGAWVARACGPLSLLFVDFAASLTRLDAIVDALAHACKAFGAADPAWGRRRHVFRP